QTIRRARALRQPNPLAPNWSFPANGWKIVESIPSAAPYSSTQPPILFRTRISGNAADDIMVFNPSMGQMALVSHPDVQPGDTTFTAGQVSARPYSGSPVAALPTRVNHDGRLGAVMLQQGDMAPYFMGPLPDPTFFPNRFDDPPPRAIGSK